MGKKRARKADKYAKHPGGLRMRHYDRTRTNDGGEAVGVWMDQFGRIFRPDERGELIPTGQCGCADH